MTGVFFVVVVEVNGREIGEQQLGVGRSKQKSLSSVSFQIEYNCLRVDRES